jgi:hypothetical protein
VIRETLRVAGWSVSHRHADQETASEKTGAPGEPGALSCSIDRSDYILG